jgi:gamma-glutamyltranspeptidase / glutathione hydrolase
MRNKNLAKTFRLLAQKGRKGFYEGEVAEAIVKVVKDLGGHLDLDDLREHGEIGTEEVDPISIKFNGQNIGDVNKNPVDGQDGQGTSSDPEKSGVEIWECPPNGQGIVALMALGLLEQLEKDDKIPKFGQKDHNSTTYLHALIEALRIAFSDANWYVTDPHKFKVPTVEMLSRPYLEERSKHFDPKKAAGIIPHGSPAQQHCDTVLFAVTDNEGNGCSFINSNYGGFGSAIIPGGTGFTLQNRGANFSLIPGHPNVYEPGKRPYHTIIPAMITNPADGSLHTVYGVMGGFMQPQGHVQVLLNMLAFGMTPQSALDAPRICIGAGTPETGKVLDRTVYLEEGISDEVVKGLTALGHEVEVLKNWNRGMFGRGQVIRVHVEDGTRVYSGGSDPRGDGCAAGY